MWYREGQPEQHGGKIIFSPERLKQLEELAKMQCTQDEISKVMLVHSETLKRIIKEQYNMEWQDFYDTYSAEGKTSLRRAQFKTAMDGNASMQIWLGKQYLGQRENLDVTNKINIDMDPVTRALESLVDNANF